MKEKFIYPLLAILLAVISTNVSAVSTDNDLLFTWKGYIHPINKDFDWDFVDKFGNPYVSTEAAFLNVNRENDPTTTPSSISLYILGEPIIFFIAPKSYDSENPTKNIINTVKARLMQRPTPNGFKSDEIIKNANDKDTILLNQVAIIINGSLIEEGKSKAVTKMGSNSSLFEISIILKARIPQANYIEGQNISFTAPVMFSVDVIGDSTIP